MSKKKVKLGRLISPCVSSVNQPRGMNKPMPDTAPPANLDKAPHEMRPALELLYKLATVDVSRDIALEPLAFGVTMAETGEIADIQPVQIGPLFANDQSKELVTRFADEMLHRGGFDVVAVWAEAWTVTRSQGPAKVADVADISVRPSQAPDRRECVMITLFTRERQLVAIAMIDRVGKRLEALQVLDEGVTGGKLVRPHQGTLH